MEFLLTTEIIEQQLHDFVAHWDGQQHKNEPVITSATYKEIQNLTKHIKQGCLSGNN